MVTHAVQMQHLRVLLGVGAVERRNPDRQIFPQLVRLDPRRVVVGEVGQDPAAVRRLPPEKLVRKRGEFVCPHQFLRHEIIDPRFLINLRQLPAVAKRVRVPANFHVHAEFVVKIAFPHENLSHERLPTGHIEVRLDPHSADNFPSSFTHTFLNFLEKIRVLFLHPNVRACGGHRELEIRVFAHQVQRASKRVAHNFHRFRPRPQPRHINVRIARGANGELLQPRIQRFQLGLRPLQRRVESRLIAAVERGEINGLHPGFELRYAFGFAFRERLHHRPRRQDLFPKNAGVRPVGCGFYA